MAAKGKSVIQETESIFGYIKGSAMWAKVLEPGEYGNFEVNLYPDEDTLNEHIETFEKLRADADTEVKEAGKKVAGLADVFKEDEDGKRFFQFKLPETDFEGKANQIKIFNKAGNDVTAEWDKLIGNGSIIKVKYMAKPYYMASTKMVGVSYRFYALQVIELEEYTGGDSGFSDETDGEEQPF